MPYEWIARPVAAPDTSGAVPVLSAQFAELHLWPYRSLPRRGFVWFIGITAGMALVPLIALIGSPLLWGILPFLLLTIGGVWWAIERSYADGAIREELRLWPDRISLIRHTPRKPAQMWEANPHWVELTIHATGGPVEHYITLRGAGREVEIGAFLTLDERQGLAADLADCLRHFR